MLKNDGRGHSYKYCDWCGKYCGTGGVNSWNHNFCSEKCKRAYDNAHGTVDGGYRSGSIGHGIHKTGKMIERVLVIILTVIFGGAIIMGIIAHFLNK